MGGRRGGAAGAAVAAAAVSAGPRHRLEGWLVAGLARALAAGPWRRGRAAGERLGDAARALGVRRAVAEDNLRAAFPERSAAARAAILREHYRELGRVVAEYARLEALARDPFGTAVAEMRGAAHLAEARAAGRGAVLLSGHFSNFELMAATIARTHPVDLVVRPMSNPRVEAWIAERRRRAGFGLMDAATGLRAVYAALRAGRFVAMLADQDARAAGVFVPFLGRPASTPVGPARLALATGAPVIMGFALRRADGRLDIEVDAPLPRPEPGAPDATERLTAAHVARLEARVRERPELWFWLHRRWKTRPAAPVAGEG